MLSVAVHKDIGEYTEKVVGKLSARTLACTAGGLASSVATAAALNLALGVPVDAATLPVMAASMPFWLMGFWRPKGLTAERYLAMLARHALSDGVLVYSTGKQALGCGRGNRVPAGGPQSAQEEQEEGGRETWPERVMGEKAPPGESPSSAASPSRSASSRGGWRKKGECAARLGTSTPP